MLSLERALTFAAPFALAVLAARPASADDAPVERPATARPAMPQSAPEPAAPVERPATSTPARATQAQPQARRRGRRRERVYATAPAARSEERSTWFYLGGGLTLLTGVSGGTNFERSNPAISGVLGVGIPLRGATGLGFELAGDAEATGQGDRGSYAGVLLRVRLSQLLSPRDRLWGALGIGRAGYLDGTLAGGFGVGNTFLFTPVFGLDLSANVYFLGASHDDDHLYEYGGGQVVLFSAKAMFELGKD